MTMPIYHFLSMRPCSSPNLSHIEIIWRERHRERRSGWDLALDGGSLNSRYLFPCAQACLCYGQVIKLFSLPSYLFYQLHNAMQWCHAARAEQISCLVSFLKSNVVSRKAAGGWRQLSYTNPLAGNDSPQCALGCSSVSALSRSPCELADKRWYDSCISAACCKGVCGVLRVVSVNLAGMWKDLWDVAQLKQ